ncbi:MAG: hypothetical protein ABEJ98_03775 [Candidatus Nanohaloarchaea archaeon]
MRGFSEDLIDTFSKNAAAEIKYIVALGDLEKNNKSINTAKIAERAGIDRRTVDNKAGHFEEEGVVKTENMGEDQKENKHELTDKGWSLYNILKPLDVNLSDIEEFVIRFREKFLVDPDKEILRDKFPQINEQVFSRLRESLDYEPPNERTRERKMEELTQKLEEAITTRYEDESEFENLSYVSKNKQLFEDLDLPEPAEGVQEFTVELPREFENYVDVSELEIRGGIVEIESNAPNPENKEKVREWLKGKRRKELADNS